VGADLASAPSGADEGELRVDLEVVVVAAGRLLPATVVRAIDLCLEAAEGDTTRRRSAEVLVNEIGSRRGTRCIALQPVAADSRDLGRNGPSAAQAEQVASAVIQPRCAPDSDYGGRQVQLDLLQMRSQAGANHRNRAST
jgi:hypothetical protein